MKLSTLEKALVFLLADDGHPLTLDEFEDCLSARDEIIALANHCEDGLETEVTPVTLYAFSNLLNVSTYDNFGRLRKAFPHNDRALRCQYRNAVRDVICEEFTNAQIDGVTDFLSDLWDTNEDCGVHNPDGSFKQYDRPCDHLEARIKELETIINKLYHHRGLSADDLSAIQTIIH